MEYIRSTAPLLTFLPQEAIPLLFVAGGFALMLGLRGIARMLFVLCGIMILLPVIIGPVRDILPPWALLPLGVIFWISVLGSVITMLIGKEAKEQMVGSLAADFAKWSFFAPFRFLRWLFRGMKKNHF